MSSEMVTFRGGPLPDGSVLEFQLPQSDVDAVLRGEREVLIGYGSSWKITHDEDGNEIREIYPPDEPV